MKSADQDQNVSRRNFLRGAGLLGLGGAASALATRVSLGASSKPARPASAPIAYDVERYRKTDPALLHYESAGSYLSPHEAPKRLAFGPDGTLWVTAGKFVTALDKQGGKTGDVAANEEVQCVAVAPDGAIHVGLRDHIEVFDAQGKRLAKWEAPAKKAWLTSLAVGEKDLFASDAGNRIVYRFDRSGKLLGRIGAKDAARDIPAFVVPSPYFDLEIGPDGLLWVVNPGFHQLQAFTFDGQLEKKWGQPSFSIDGFCGCCNPSYFTLLADGRFVTSEKGLSRIKVYAADGKFESVVAGQEAFPKYSENINTAPIPVDVAADAAGRIYVADTLGHEIRVYKRKVTV
jgi:sugar lactone lactonase YvrE